MELATLVLIAEIVLFDTAFSVAVPNLVTTPPATSELVPVSVASPDTVVNDVLEYCAIHSMAPTSKCPP